MKIRAITLINIRRFAGKTASIQGIGDGITVLSEPNEFGKSTIFDALHALFFERHRSTKSAVKSLQPHVGGAPEVELTVEMPEGRFRIRKRWLSRATAQVHDDSGRLVAQDDEAEAWIDRLLGQGVAGPTGLLWVRQGLVGLEPEGNSAAEKNERDQNLTARRDLLSSVAGEIEMMTGGRRMDAVLRRVGQALDPLATATLRPKAGGDWAMAVQEVEQLEKKRASLAEQVARLSGALQRRSDAQRQLRQVTDPEGERLRKEALKTAEAALEAARTHAAKVDDARRGLNLAQMTLDRTETEVARLLALRKRLSEAETVLARDIGRESGAGQTAGARRAELDRASQALMEAQSAVSALRSRLSAAQKSRLAAAARLTLDQLVKSLGQAEDLLGQLESAKAQRGLILATARSVADAERAQLELERVTARIDVQAVTLGLQYAGAARVLRDGIPVPEGAQRLHVAAEFDLPGLGRLRIDPGQGSGDPQAELAVARANLAERLSACGAPDLAAAKVKLEEARRLEEDIRRFEAVISQIAPEGLAALRQAAATTRAEAREDDPAPEDAERLEQELAAAEQTESGARIAAAELQRRADATGQELAAAVASRLAAERQLADVRAEAGDPDGMASRLQTLEAERIGQAGGTAAAERALRGLEAVNLDLATAEAGLVRAKSADERARKDLSTLQMDLAQLDGTIGALAEEGIEEQLDEVSGRLAAARDRAGRLEAEVGALTRLRQALEAARKAARDAYFGPVLRELGPLLSILHPGAQLQIDDESLLPVALMRDGLAEPLDILSGGTREQVAILTRLAFARLFAQAGQSVPVILDDALVHSDDDRIEAMFTALHRAAKDQQILVLTCRQRAFASLGGDRARAEIAVL